MFIYRFGIEEEYFLFDLRTRNVRALMPKEFFRTAKQHLKAHVTNELLQSQIEIATSPCKTMNEAREQIASFRAILNRDAERYRLGIVAAGTHPLAAWREQKYTPKDRYRGVVSDIQMVGLRNLLCGMHVHVEVPDPARRIETIYRTIPFLPILLALSTSSPFWDGHQTGLLGYRLAANDEMPRSGLPDLFKTTAEYDRYVTTLVAANIIKDASYVWWAIRPSLRLPTIELRITDICTHLSDAICLAAIFRCLVRYLAEHPEVNADLDGVDRAFAEENKWRAQRYGIGASFIERDTMEAKPVKDLVTDMLGMLREDAQALDCLEEIEHVNEIIRRGTSANEQIRIYTKARIGGRPRRQALRDVVDWLHRTTMEADAAPALVLPEPVSEEQRLIY